MNIASAFVTLHHQEQIAHAATSIGCEYQHYPAEQDFLPRPSEEMPSVLVLSLDGFAENSLALHDRLRHDFEPISVIYVAQETKVPNIVRAMQLGAVSVLAAESSNSQLEYVIRDALSQFQIRRKWISAIRNARQAIERLSSQQRRVMKMVAAGWTNVSIGRELQISPKTVEKHRQRLHLATCTQTVTDLVRLTMTADLPLNAAFCLPMSPTDRHTDCFQSLYTGAAGPLSQRPGISRSIRR